MGITAEEMRRRDTATDLLINENSEAVALASAAAGAYLEKINQTHLERFTVAQWDAFLKVIIKEYINNAVPF